MSLTSANKRSITKIDNPENEKRRSLEDQLDDFAPRQNTEVNPDPGPERLSSGSYHNPAGTNSPQNLELPSSQPLTSPSSQIQDSPQQFGLQPQRQLSSQPSQIEARKNSPQNLGIQGSGSFQNQALNQGSAQQPQQQKTQLTESAQIYQTPKQHPNAIHEESVHVEVKDDSLTYGMSPGGLPDNAVGNPTKAGRERSKPPKPVKKPPPKPQPRKKSPPKKVKQPKPLKQEKYHGQAMPKNDFLHFDQTIPTQEFALQQQPQQQYNQQMQPQVATQQQIGILPPRTTAFQAPFVPLRTRDPNYRPDGSDPHIQDDDEGLNFSFNPRADCATEVTFTVEPRKRPMWQTMMNCGFTPVIYCSVPPCCLPGNGAPGQPNCCGQAGESSSEDSSSGSEEDSSEDDDQGGAVAVNTGRAPGQAQSVGRPSIKPGLIAEKNYNVQSLSTMNAQSRHSTVSRKSSKSGLTSRANSVYQKSEKGDSLDFSSDS